ncbi:MAG: hypothetical protein R3C45_21830, partial [Phycisphaerales bacterium]
MHGHEKQTRHGVKSARRRLALTGGCLVLAITAQASHAQVRTIAMEGDAAPDTSFTFSGFEGAPVLNDNGEVAFIAAVDDFNTTGVWSEGDGIGLLRNVALTGDTAPDTGGAIFLGLINVHLNALGDVFIKAELDDSRFGLWSDRERPSTDLTKIVVDDDPAPGTNSREFRFGPVFNGP